jgi:hypothetical protein
VRVRGHNTAGIGDVVQSRLNDHQAGVLNRDRWQVVGTGDDGALHVRQVLGPNRYADEVRVLEPAYVRRQVELAYAGTTLAVEGVTVRGGTSHKLVSRMTSAAHAYVGGSRGTEANYWHVELEEGETAAGRLAAIVADDKQAKSAHDEMADAELREASLGHLFVLWETAVREARAVAHRDMLLAELGDDAAAVLADPSSHRLFGVLRQAEIEGHNPHALVASVMAKRRAQHNPLSAVESPASLLYARVSDEMKVAGLGEPCPASFESRVPAPRAGEVETEEQAAARRIGRVIDGRKAQLALEAANDAPQWAVRAAGAVPTDDVERVEWMRRVENAAALREAQGYTDQRDPIGRRPSHVEPERVWLWDQAAARIGLSEHDRNLRALEPAELANRVQAWQRVEAVAPRCVDADLRETHIQWADLRQRITMGQLEGRDTFELESQALALEEDARKLERVAEVRADWLERHIGLQHRAEDALAEQDRRAELEAARDGVPLPPDDPEAEPELDPEAEARQVEDAETAARAAVFDLLSARHEPAPQYGSPEWVALADDDPRKQAAVAQAAAAWWNLGAPRDQEVAELQARLEAAAEVIGVPAADPEVDEDTLAVLAWQDPHLHGEAPVFGSPEWAGLEEADPRREAATVRAASAWWRLGEPLEVLQERTEAAEDRASSIEISRYEAQQREQAHRQRVERERAERIAEETEERRAWARPVEVSPDELSVDGLAAAEMDYRDPEASETDREMAGLFLASQGIEPAREEEPEGEVVWPEPAPIPEPEADNTTRADAVEPTGQTPSDEVGLAEPEPEPAVVEPEVVRPEPIETDRTTAEPEAEDLGVAEPETKDGPVSLSGPEPEPRPEEPAPHREVPTVSGPEPEPEPYREPDVEPEVDEPEPEDESEPDEDRFQAGLEWSLEQARLQREADQQAQREEADRAARAEREADEVGASDDRAARSARFEADLRQAEEAAAIMAERREAEQEPVMVEPESEPQVETEVEV